MPASSAISSGIFTSLGVPPANPGGHGESVGLPRCFALLSISLGGPTSYDGVSSGGRHMQAGVTQSTTQGNPSPPSLQLSQPGFWRFRWTVQSGTRTLSIMVMQSANTSPYPSLTVKANSAIGVNSDVTGTSPGGTSWVKIGPVTVSPTSEGVLWVELHNNLNLFTFTVPGQTVGSPCYFGQIIAT